LNQIRSANIKQGSKPSPATGDSHFVEETPQQFLKRHNLGSGGFPQHHRLKEALANRGFVVRQVERFDEAPVWKVVLRPGTVANGRQPTVIRREVTAALRALGHQCLPRDVSALSEGNRLTIGLVWDGGGKPGRLVFTERGWQQLELYPGWRR
jgi:hypothetical protein